MSKTVLTLPISPHPRDLEPSDPNTSYSIEVLSLYVTSGRRQEYKCLKSLPELFPHVLRGSLVLAWV